MQLYHRPWKLVQNQIRSPGGYAIDMFRGRPFPKDIPNGSEAWVGSLTRANGANESCPDFGCSEVELPDGRRMYLYEAINLDPEEVLGSAHLARFGTGLGLLVKLLDAKSQYFLQAHPTRPAAKKLWNSPYGKEECWFILGRRDDAPEPPYLLLGFKPGITRERFEDLFHNGTLQDLEQLCNKVTVRPGEMYFVPGGLAHALGAGNLVIEVQEPSDLAVVAIPQQELIDYRRKAAPNGIFEPEDNDLYEKRMFETFIFEGMELPDLLARTRSQEPLLRSGPWGTEHLLIGPEQTPYFSCTKATVNGGRMPLLPTGEIRIGIVLRGEGSLESPSGCLAVRQGDELFFPYDTPDTYLCGDVELFLANPADAKL